MVLSRLSFHLACERVRQLEYAYKEKKETVKERGVRKVRGYGELKRQTMGDMERDILSIS